MLLRGDAGSEALQYGKPHVAAAASGKVLATWLRVNADGSIDLEARLHDPATDTASAVFTVATGRAEETPAIAALENGGFVIATIGAADESVAYAIVSADGTAGPAITVGTTDTDGREDENPAVAGLAGGGFVVAWTGTGADRTPRTFFHGVTPDGEFSGTAGPAFRSKLAALPDGGFVLVQGDMGAGALEAFSHTADGTRVGAQGFARFAYPDDAVTLGDGRVAVAWNTGNDIALEILDTRAAVSGTAPQGWQVGTNGADVFTSAATAQVVASWRGNDAVTEGGGPATFFRLGDGNDRMIVTSGLDGDSFGGEGGNDHIDWSRSTARGVTFDLAGGEARLGARMERMTGFENLAGTQNRDTILGTAAANALGGQAGDDLLRGRGGADILVGGTGQDTLDGGAGHDRLEGGAGNDTYVLAAQGDIVVEAAGGGSDQVNASVSATLGAHVEALVLTGSGSIGGMGNALANRLTGNGAANALRGAEGNDRIEGRGGADAIAGGCGADILAGGGGADDFVFASTADSGLGVHRDVITDFARGQDDLAFLAIDANLAVRGNQAFRLDAGGTFAAGELRQTRLGSDLLVALNTDSDAAAEMTVLLKGVTSPLAASDFLL